MKLHAEECPARRPPPITSSKTPNQERQRVSNFVIRLSLHDKSR